MANKTILIAALAAGALLAAAAAEGTAEQAPATAPEAAIAASAAPGSAMSAAARGYLESALDIIQKNSINRKRIPWESFRAGILGLAGAAQCPGDTHKALDSALARLGDSHSFLMPPLQAKKMRTGAIARNEAPDFALVEGRYAYVAIPPYRGMNESLMRDYAAAFQKRIAEFDGLEPLGWIVDLRSNSGGNMWPMILGLGPLIGEGIAGYWIDPDGKRKPWSYEGGRCYEDGELVLELGAEAYRLKRPDPPIALLIGSGTASSGEIVALSLIGKPGVRSFGQTSAGRTTANGTFELPDGALMFLTTETDADRTGRPYPLYIEPDEYIGGLPTAPPRLPREVLDWLRTQARSDDMR